MNKIALLLALGSLFSSLFFFFIEKDLFIGSIAFLLCVVFNLVFAMLNKINKTDEKI